MMMRSNSWSKENNREKNILSSIVYMYLLVYIIYSCNFFEFKINDLFLQRCCNRPILAPVFILLQNPIVHLFPECCCGRIHGQTLMIDLIPVF